MIALRILWRQSMRSLQVQISHRLMPLISSAFWFEVLCSYWNPLRSQSKKRLGSPLWGQRLREKCQVWHNWKCPGVSNIFPLELRPTSWREFDPVKSEANRDKQNRFQGGVVGQATPIRAREHFLVTPMRFLRARFGLDNPTMAGKLPSW